MKLTSPEFVDKRRMPKRFTCEGEDINPPLVIEDIPAEIVIEDIHLEIKSLALIVVDPDVPSSCDGIIPTVGTSFEYSSRDIQSNIREVKWTFRT